MNTPLTAVEAGKAGADRVLQVNTARWLFTARVSRGGRIVSAVKVGGGIVRSVLPQNLPEPVVTALRAAQ